VTGSASDIAAFLRARQSFVLTSHARPDGDAIGSTVALALALEHIGKRTTIVFHDPLPEPYRVLPGVDRILRAERTETEADAAVLLECSDPGRTEVAGLDRYPLVNIDHHLGNTLYGAANWFDPSAAACGEMVADIVDALGVPWTPALASHLFLAVSTDTGGFRYGPMTPRTFEVARRVAAAGVDVATLARQIFDSYSIGRVKLTGAILSAMELYHDDRFAVLALDDDLLRRCGATIDDAEGLVNMPLAAREVRASALFKRQGDNTFRVSLRSKEDVDVRQIAALWQGGGHKNAAGCTISGTLADAKAALIKAMAAVL